MSLTEERASLGKNQCCPKPNFGLCYIYISIHLSALWLFSVVFLGMVWSEVGRSVEPSDYRCSFDLNLACSSTLSSQQKESE